MTNPSANCSWSDDVSIRGDGMVYWVNDTKYTKHEYVFWFPDYPVFPEELLTYTLFDGTMIMNIMVYEYVAASKQWRGLGYIAKLAEKDYMETHTRCQNQDTKTG